MPNGRTGHWMRDYATREDAQRAIDDRMADTGLTYVVEEVATPEDRIRELEAELAQLRDAYDAANQDLDVAKRNVARLEEALAASRQGPAKASKALGEGGDSGEGAGTQ